MPSCALCYLTTLPSHGGLMRFLSAVVVSCTVLFSVCSSTIAPASSAPSIFGFRDAAAETAMESRFLAVPDAKLAEEHLRILTKDPHMAGTLEDKATADYVAQKFR